MIQAVTDYVLAPFQKIKRPDGSSLKVYPPDEYRDLGQAELPCLALSLNIAPKDELDRPHHKIFLPSDEQQTITIPEQFGHSFHAEVAASNAEPYVIEAGRDLIAFRVGTPGAWGPDEMIVLPPGSRAAWEIARAGNYYATSIKADYWAGTIYIRTAKPGMDLEILETDGSAYEVLGLTPGVVSHLTRTGPVSYTVKPHPMPVIFHYEVELRAAEKAQRDALLPMVMNLFPENHWPTINGQSPHFRRSDHKDLDELVNPEWWSVFMLEADCIWLDRKDAYQVGSIVEPAVEFAGV